MTTTLNHPIPLPSGHWRTRALLPAGLFLCAGSLLAWAGRDALRPAVAVVVMPVGLAARTHDAHGAAPGAEPGAAAPAHTPHAGAPAVTTGEPIVQAAGWVEADPFSVGVPALTDGVVQDVLALEGQTVEADQVLVRLISRDAELAIARAQAELFERGAELDLARADLAAAQETWDNPVERTRALAVAQAMHAEAQAELDRAQAQAAADRARFDEMRDEAERKRDLVESGGVSKGELARIELRLKAALSQAAAADAAHAAAQARLLQAAAELQAAEQSSRLRTDETRALASARARVVQAQGAVARFTVMRDEAQLRLDRTHVRSPIAGVVLARLVEPGTRVQMFSAEGGPQTTASGGGGSAQGGATVMRLYDPARLQVRVDVPLADAWKIAVGQRADVTSEAMPNRTFRGHVSRIVSQADITRNTLQVKVALDPPTPGGGPGVGPEPGFGSTSRSAGPTLKPEMLTRVKFFAIAANDASRASQDPGSPGTGDDRDFAFLARASDLEQSSSDPTVAHAWVVEQRSNSADHRTLRLARVGGAPVDGWLRVIDGLRPGDRIIVSPSTTPGLRQGVRVRIVSEETASDSVTPALDPNAPHRTEP